jgi:EpsI family protein
MTPELGPAMRPIPRRMWMFAAVGACASAASILLKHQEQANATKPVALDLETVIPTQFGQWRMAPKPVQQVNPSTQALLDKLYSQIVERTYIGPDGYAIMLSVSYGADQRGSLEAHKPEVCYPAQGFVLRTQQETELQTPFGQISAKQLDTAREERQEPLTYWFTVGNSTVQNRVEKRLTELRLTLTGKIPDGLLFRVSSIDKSAPQAWARQAAFVNEMLAQCSPQSRRRLAGV